MRGGGSAGFSVTEGKEGDQLVSQLYGLGKGDQLVSQYYRVRKGIS